MKTNAKQQMQNLPFLVLAAVAAAAIPAGPALADPISGQVGLASQYLGKGLGKSDEDPAFFGSVRWAANGFYASGFASQAASSKGSDAEVIVNVGYARALGGWNLDGQVMYREMLNETNGVDSGFVEWQGDVSRDLTDRLSARLRLNYASDTYGAAEEAWWTEAQATLTLTSKDKLSVAYAQRRVDGGADYDAWNIGVKHKISPAVSADLRWYDTDGHEFGSRYEGRLVASVAYSF